MNNEPAFPCENTSHISPGLSKLEYAAIEAMKGFIMCITTLENEGTADVTDTYLARAAINQAKVLLAELEKEQ